MSKDKTLAIAFHEEVYSLARKIWKKEGCSIQEAFNKTFHILIPKYLKIFEEKSKIEKKK